MKTKEQIITELKAEYPTLKTGSDEVGYTDLTAVEYEFKIADWADASYAKELKEEAEAEAKTDKEALLAKLGITADEAKLLLN